MTPIFPFVQFEFTHSVGPPAGRYVVGDPTGSDRAPELDLETIEPDRRPPAPRAPARTAVASAAQHGAPAARPRLADAPAAEEDAEQDAEADEPEADYEATASLGSADVLVVKVLGAPPPKPRMFRRGLPPQVDGEPPRELSVTLVTAILSTRALESDATATGWLRELRADQDAAEAFVADGLEMLNRAVRAYRACAADPYVVELNRIDARAVRLGYGAPADVVLGKWTGALSIAAPPPPRVTRTVQLMPTQGMAAVLAGQSDVLESEELVLRALLDLRHERLRGAAAGLEAALELLLGEVAGEVLPAEAQARMGELLEVRDRTKKLAAAARRGELGEQDGETLRDIAERLGAFIDQRRYAPMGF